MYKIHNVLSNQERKKIIKDVKPFLMTSEQLQSNYNHSYDYPGKQTDSVLHLRPEFSSTIKKILDKVIEEIGMDLQVYQSWVKWSNGREDQMNWHMLFILLLFVVKETFRVEMVQIFLLKQVEQTYLV